MTELEITPLNCPYSKPAELLRVFWDFFVICFAFGQNEIEYPKQSNISDTHCHTNYTGDDGDIHARFQSLFPQSTPHQSLKFLIFFKYTLYVVPS